MNEIAFFYKLVDNQGNSYKNTSVDKIRVALYSDIADFRKAILKENSAILTGVVAAQLTVYSKVEFEKEFKVALEEDLSVEGLGQDKKNALVVVVPVIEIPLLENIILEKIKELKKGNEEQIKELKQGNEELKKGFNEIKNQLKYDRSTASSSQKDIEISYEKYARKAIQSELYKVLKVTNFNIESAKILDDATVFKAISPYCGERTDGEIDVYLGIVAPPVWHVVDPVSSDFHIINGSFQGCCDSLESSRLKISNLESPTTNELEVVFNYYSIFEVTHQSKLGFKLKQLEYQLQYIVARHFQRTEKEFPPRNVSSLLDADRVKAYNTFVGLEILQLVCFAGLIMPYDFDEKEKVIIDETRGKERPCLYSLLQNQRLMYLKSQTLSQRVEMLEETLRAQKGDNLTI
jgi:hypothetical protein